MSEKQILHGSVSVCAHIGQCFKGVIKWLFCSPWLWLGFILMGLVRVCVENIHSSIMGHFPSTGKPDGYLINRAISQSIHISNMHLPRIFSDAWAYLGQPIYLFPASNGKVSVGMAFVLVGFWVLVFCFLCHRVVRKVRLDGLKAFVFGVLGITLLVLSVIVYWFLVMSEGRSQMFRGVFSLTVPIQLFWDIANALLGALFAVFYYESYRYRNTPFTLQRFCCNALSPSFRPLFVYYLLLLCSIHLLKTLPVLGIRYFPMSAVSMLIFQRGLNVLASCAPALLFFVPAVIITTGLGGWRATQKCLMLWRNQSILFLCISMTLLLSGFFAEYVLEVFSSVFHPFFFVVFVCIYALSLICRTFCLIAMCCLHQHLFCSNVEILPVAQDLGQRGS